MLKEQGFIYHQSVISFHDVSISDDFYITLYELIENILIICADLVQKLLIIKKKEAK